MTYDKRQLTSAMVGSTDASRCSLGLYSLKALPTKDCEFNERSGAQNEDCVKPDRVCPAAPGVLEATLQKVDAVLERERRGLRDAAPGVLEATLQKVDAVLERERRGLRGAVLQAVGVQPEHQQQRQQVDLRLEDQVLRLAAEVGSLTSQVRAARQDSDDLRERIQVLESPVAAQAVFSSEIPKQMTEESLDVATAHITDRFTDLQDRVDKALLLWRKVDLKLLIELRTDVDHLRNKSPVDHGYSKMVDNAFAAVFPDADDPGLMEGAVVPVVTASPKDVEVLQQQIKEQVSETEVLTESMAQCNEKQAAMEKCMVTLGQEWGMRLMTLTSKVESSMSLLENARKMYSGVVDDKYSKQPSAHRIESCR